MTVDSGSFWLGFIAAPGALLIAALLAALILRMAGKNIGKGGCQVCDHGFTCNIGEYTRLGVWVRSRRHNWIISSRKWHREAWARNRWNPYRLPGYPQDSGTAAVRRPKPHILRRTWWAIAV